MKDTQRLILFVIFTFSLMMLWEQWQKENRPPAPQQTAAQTAASGNASSGSGAAQVPMPSTTSSAAVAGAVPAANPSTLSTTATAQRARIKVITDQFLVQIDPIGGELSYLELLTQRDTGDTSRNFVLLGPEHRYANQSGLIGDGLPNHTTVFNSAKAEYRLEDGQDTLEVRLEAAALPGALA